MMGALAAVVLTLALAAAAPASAPRDRAVHFRTLWRTSGEGTGKLPFTTGKPLTAAAIVWSRKGEALNTGPTFVGSAHLAALDRFAWGKRFALVAAIVRPTTGFSIRVRRITDQHPTPEIEQFCVIATVSKPRSGQPVEQRRTVSAHVVQIARRSFGVAVPEAAILRSSDGELLSSTTTFGPVRPGACRA
jgi:hypothetical protein